MPCLLSSRSRSVLANALEHQCSWATIPPWLRCEFGADPAAHVPACFFDQAVRITERGERAVASVIGRGPADSATCAVRLKLSTRRPGMEHLADLDTAGDELFVGDFDVRDNQVEALGRTGDGRRDLRAELDRHPEPGGVNWITWKPLSKRKSASSRHPSLL